MNANGFAGKINRQNEFKFFRPKVRLLVAKKLGKVLA